MHLVDLLLRLIFLRGGLRHGMTWDPSVRLLIQQRIESSAVSRLFDSYHQTHLTFSSRPIQH